MKRGKQIMKTNWNLLLESDGTHNGLLYRWAFGRTSTRYITSKLVGTRLAGEFRRLVRTHGTMYAKRLARKAFNRRFICS